jgi:hypothetical protein
MAVFVADVNGGVYSTSGSAEAGWSPLTSVSEGSTTRGAPIGAVMMQNRVALFLADPGGGVFAIDGLPHRFRIRILNKILVAPTVPLATRLTNLTRIYWR